MLTASETWSWITRNLLNPAVGLFVEERLNQPGPQLYHLRQKQGLAVCPTLEATNPCMTATSSDVQADGSSYTLCEGTSDPSRLFQETPASLRISFWCRVEEVTWEQRTMERRDLTTLVFRLSNLRHTFKDFNLYQKKSVTTERLRCRLNIKKSLRDSCSHLCIYFSYYLNCLNFPHSSWYCFVIMMIMVMMAVVMMVVVMVVIAAAVGVWWMVLVNMMMTTTMIIVQGLVDEG